MYTILMLNQKGGVGKTTIADELSFALERRGKTVAFVTTDPQGGSVHEVCDDPDFAEECDFQVVDTAGVLVGGVNDWCRAANLILVPMLPSTRDMEPTLRTLDIVRESGTGAKAYVIVNNFYAYGTLDRQLVEYLEGEEVPIIAKIPRAVALSRAAAAGVSVADYDPKSHVVAPIELLADSVLNEEERTRSWRARRSPSARWRISRRKVPASMRRTRWNSRKSVSSSRLGSTKKRNSTASRRGRA